MNACIEFVIQFYLLQQNEDVIIEGTMIENPLDSQNYIDKQGVEVRADGMSGAAAYPQARYNMGSPNVMGHPAMLPLGSHPVNSHGNQPVSIYNRHNGLMPQQPSIVDDEAGLDSQDALSLMDGESQALQSAVMRMLEKDSSHANKDLAKEAEHFSDLLVDALHEVSGGAQLPGVAKMGQKVDGIFNS